MESYIFQQSSLCGFSTMDGNKMKEQIIQKVWENKSNKQKAVTIPKDSGIEKGDHVIIRKVQIKIDDESRLEQLKREVLEE